MFKRARRFGALFLIVGLVSALVGVSPAGSSVALDSPFQSTDGELDDGVALVNTDETQSSTDDSYTGGAHEKDLCPTVADGSIPPSKADLSAVYGAMEEGTDGHTYLYLAWARTDTNGTATLDFELNQSDAESCNGVNPARTSGDVLITYDFQGGQVDKIEVRIWDGSKWGDPVDILDSGFALGEISADLKFGELAVDLEGAGIFTEGECVSFASVFVKSRASDSFQSELKDLIAPAPMEVTNCGSLKVTKTVVGGKAGDSFGFTVDCGAVDLGTDDEFSLENGGSKTIADLPLGTTCSVTETVPGASAYWTTTYKVDAGSAQSGRVASGVSIASLGTRTVAFTNTRVTGSLTITKAADAPGDFTFDIDCDDNEFDQSDVSAAPGAPYVLPGIPTGTVCTVTEDDNPDFNLTQVIPADGERAIDADGETVAFTNVLKRGNLIVAKTTEGGTGTFTFDVDCDGTEFDQTVEITNTGSQAISGIPTGTSCTVSERDNPLYSSIVIPDDGMVEIGEDAVTVAFTNTRNTGPLTIAKTALGGTGAFTFDVNCTDDSFDQVVTIEGSGTETIMGIPTTTSCTVTERAHALFTTEVVPGDGTVGIDAGGQTVAFTNTAKPNGISLDKKVNGADHATSGDALIAHSGDSLTYTVVITNTGQVPLTISGLSDSLFAGFAASCPQGVGSVLAAGASFTCTYQGSAAGDDHNVVSVNADDGLGRSVDDSDDTFVDVIHPAVSIVKTADPLFVTDSGSVTYTYVVTNTGDTTLNNVLVTDDILGAIGSTGTLAPGGSVTMAKTVDVNTLTPPVNIGTVTGTDILGQTVTASDDAVITVVLGAVELPRTGGLLQSTAQVGLALLVLGLGFHMVARLRRGMAVRAS